MLLAGFILLYSPLIVNHFNTVSTYADPFYRILEFMIGSFGDMRVIIPRLSAGTFINLADLKACGK